MEEKGATVSADPHAAALSRVAVALAGDRESAGREARRILESAPAHPGALAALAAAHRLAGDTQAAVEEFGRIAGAHPGSAAAQFEFGLAARAAGRHETAAEAFARTVALDPAHRQAWRRLGDGLAALGRTADAARAYQAHFRLGAREWKSLEAGIAAGPGPARAALDAVLAVHPADVTIALMYAEIELRLGRHAEAERRLAEILSRAPGFAAARYTLALALHKQTKVADALRELDRLLDADPGNAACLNLRALSLVHLGDYARAIATYERLLAADPETAAVWVGYGHALKTVGRIEDAVAAYRKATALQPDLGEAWWQLADLKTFRFAQPDIRKMRKALSAPALADDSRAQLHFALGKALEDSGDFAAAFAEYAEGNAVRRRSAGYDAAANAGRVRRSTALFTEEFFSARRGAGCLAPDPIFIVGLTRSGSTLAEQILASHPLIEGTAELPAVNAIAARLEEEHGPYPELLARLDRGEFAKLGEEYLALTRVHRTLGRPFFIDKMPGNFLHLGLLHLILPNAKIVDARRHPLACGFANFKQHFTHGQTWSYDLRDIGSYYRDYVETMAHFDAVLPGRVHRVIYEALVEDPEREARRLLEYCGLPFDEACLRFHENRRPVLTASAEQVRRPIFRDSLEQWRRFDPWLGPLRDALGRIVDAYPAAPPQPD
ncbi:MAG TPA: sulfotransferase [Rhizomicrobium sp.]|nr:sulfotransferase [Rhizomicrobium sp.]